MNLLDQVKELPANNGHKVRTCWADYVEPFWVLVNEKNYNRKAAAEKLGELAGLTEDETRKLHNASKGWKNPNQ